MTVLVTSEAMDVASKYYIPSMDSKADRFGLVAHGNIMLRVMSHCYNILHQVEVLNVSGVIDFIANKLFFQVQI